MATIESMLDRFRGLTKEQMIAKYKHPNCAKMWDAHDRLLAQTAMKQLLSVPGVNVKIVPMTFEQEIQTMPETLIVKPAEKTADQLFQEELLDKPLDAEDEIDVIMMEAEASEGLAPIDQPKKPEDLPESKKVTAAELRDEFSLNLPPVKKISVVNEKRTDAFKPVKRHQPGGVKKA